MDVYLTPFMDGRGRPAGGPLDGDGRRSLYIKVRRNFLSPMMLAYDTPIPFATVGRRSVSNVPAQALILMNDPFVVAAGGGLGQASAGARAQATPTQRITGMYLQAFARPPTRAEMRRGHRRSSSRWARRTACRRSRADDERVWADFAHVLFNVKEFIFVR